MKENFVLIVSKIWSIKYVLNMKEQVGGFNNKEMAILVWPAGPGCRAPRCCPVPSCPQYWGPPPWAGSWAPASHSSRAPPAGWSSCPPPPAQSCPRPPWKWWYWLAKPPVSDDYNTVYSRIIVNSSKCYHATWTLPWAPFWGSLV